MGNRSGRLSAVRTLIESIAEAIDQQRLRLHRSALAQRVARRRLLLIAVAVVVAWAVADQVAGAQAERSAWGRTVMVVVATTALAPGDPLTETVTSLHAVPLRLVPEGALTSLPSDRRTRAEIGVGEMVTSARLAPDGTGAMGSRLPTGTRAVTVGLGDAPAPVRPGDVVDALAVGSDADPYSVDDQAPGRIRAQVVAAHAVVLEVGAEQATLAVHEDQVLDIVGADVVGGVRLVITN